MKAVNISPYSCDMRHATRRDVIGLREPYNATNVSHNIALGRKSAIFDLCFCVRMTNTFNRFTSIYILSQISQIVS